MISEPSDFASGKPLISSILTLCRLFPFAPFTLARLPSPILDAVVETLNRRLFGLGMSPVVVLLLPRRDRKAADIRAPVDEEREEG